MQWNIKQRPKKEAAISINTNKSGGHYINQNKPDTEEQILCIYTYMRYLK